MFEIDKELVHLKPVIVKDLVQSGLMYWPEYHIAEGLRYGFKECCIKNYINLMLLGFPPAKFMYEVLGQHTYGVHYVMCPLCYAEYDAANPNRPREEIIFAPSKLALRRETTRRCSMKRRGNMIWTVLTQVFGCIVLIKKGVEFTGRLRFMKQDPNWVRIQTPNNLGKYILTMFPEMYNANYTTIGFQRGPWRIGEKMYGSTSQYCVIFGKKSNFALSIEKKPGSKKTRYYISGPKDLILEFLGNLVSF